MQSNTWQKIHRTGPVESMCIGDKKLTGDIYLYIYRLDDEDDKPAYRLMLHDRFLKQLDFGGWHFKSVDAAKKWAKDNPSIIADIVSWRNRYLAIFNKIAKSRRLEK